LKEYFNPVHVVEAEDWYTQLKKSIKYLDLRSPIIVTSLGNRTRLSLDKLFPFAMIYSEVSPNPNFNDCSEIIHFCNDNYFDGVIAIGGGSVMDLAKVIISSLSLQESNILRLIDHKSIYPNTIPSIFIPTTHGTGSEVTMWGTIWNLKEKKKYSISSPSLYPTIAILDGSLTLTLSLKYSIITILDTLSHSFESIWNKSANKKSTELAIEAITIILKNIEAFKETPENLAIRSKFLIASNIAGLAFSNTKTAAAHSISYPLTINFDIPHGIASSITLPSLINFNKSKIDLELNEIIKGVNFNDISILQNFIRDIPHKIFKNNLKSWGILKTDLKTIAKLSFSSSRMQNNILKITEPDVLKILEEVY
jgi:alcohol dehydrogenase class IV